MQEPTKTVKADKVESEQSFDETLIQTRNSPSHDSFPTIPGYHITREIARGGMGKVFEATELSLGRTIAIKTILPGMDTSRFETESRITAQLPHPSIPPVHALGYLSDGTPFLAMKLIQGVTLASLLKERASETDDVSRFVQIMEQVAQAVGFAHSQGMIHRDLKPQNIMVGSFGEIQVMDWGLAKKLGKEERYDQPSITAMPENQATMAGTVMGTPGYMSPEQARGEPVDCRADVFSIGSMLSTVLTGSPAFVGSSAIETIQLASQGKLEDAMQRLSKPTIAPELRAIASRCLANDPADRYQNGQEVADALAAYRNGLEQRLRSIEVERATELTRRLERKKRMKVLGGSVVGAALLSLAAYFASGHLASMNERIAAESEKESAYLTKQTEEIASKSATEQRFSELRERIKDQLESTEQLYDHFYELGEWLRTGQPLGTGSALIGFNGMNKDVKIYLHLDISQGINLYIQQPNLQSPQLRYVKIRKSLTPSHRMYKDMGEGHFRVLEENILLNSNTGSPESLHIVYVDERYENGKMTNSQVTEDVETGELDYDRLLELSGYLEIAKAFYLTKVVPARRVREIFFTGNWLESDFRNLVAGGLSDLQLGEYEYMTLATAFLYFGELDMYHNSCNEMLNRFSQTEPKSDRTAKACLLADHAVERMELVHSLADQMVVGTNENAFYDWYVMVKGLSDYRAGKYQDAVHWLTVEFSSKPDSQPANEQLAFVSAVLAMSYHRLEDSENAKAELTKAKAIIDEKMPSIDHPDPNRKGPRSIDWLQAEILTREAASLIENH